ncbi:MAG: MerR family transcriptional regulator [Paracoccaceae bacterium]
MKKSSGNWTTLRIGELASILGITTKTLRHYEKKGLIVPSGRLANDYRVYDCDDQRRARDIMGLRAIGLSIPEIQNLFQNNADDQSIRSRLLGILDEKLREKEETLSILQGQRDDLQARSLELFNTPTDKNGTCICKALLQKCDCLAAG